MVWASSLAISHLMEACKQEFANAGAVALLCKQNPNQTTLQWQYYCREPTKEGFPESLA